MPQLHKLEKKCPTNRNERLRDPMCRLPDKEFEPHKIPRPPPKPAKPGTGPQLPYGGEKPKKPPPPPKGGPVVRPGTGPQLPYGGEKPGLHGPVVRPGTGPQLPYGGEKPERPPQHGLRGPVVRPSEADNGQIQQLPGGPQLPGQGGEANIDPTIVNGFLHNTIKTIYNQEQIKQMPPELQEQADFINFGYKNRQLYDTQIEEERREVYSEAYDTIYEASINDRNALKAFVDEDGHFDHKAFEKHIIIEANKQADEVSSSESANFVEQRQQFLDGVLLEMQSNLNDKYGAKYTIDTELTTADEMFIVNNETGKVNIVLRGAGAGAEGTQTGDAINKFDMGSAFGAYKDNVILNAIRGGKPPTTEENYPYLRSLGKRAIEKYGLDRLRTVSYSNGNTKGHFFNKELSIPSTTFDGVVGTQQMKDLQAGMPAEAHYVRTTKTGVGIDGLFGSNYITNPSRLVLDPLATTNPGLNVKLTTINPLDTSMKTNRPDVYNKLTTTEKFKQVGSETFNSLQGRDGHSREHFSTPAGEGTRLKPGFTDGAISTLKSTPQSILTGLLAGGTTGSSFLDLEPKIGHEGNLVATAGVNVVYDSLAAGTYSALTGTTAGAATFTTAASTGGLMALPTLAAYEAADHVGQAMTKATENWKNRGVALLDTGAASGAVGGAAGMATYLGVVKAVNSARTLAAGTTEAAEGAEALTYGAGSLEALSTPLLGAEAESAALEGGLGAAEVVAEGAAATGGMVATEETAGAIALIPVPGARAVAGVVAMAGLVGGGLAFIFGDHESKESKERKALAKYHEISDKYLAAVRHQYINPYGETYNHLRPEDILEKQEIDFMNSMSTTYFTVVDDHVENLWNIEHETFQLVDRSNKNRVSDHGGFYTTSKLSEGERRLLQLNAPDYYKQWQDTTKAYREEQSRLHLTDNNYQDYREFVDNGQPVDDLYTDMITNQAHDAGYANAQNYIDDQENHDYRGRYKELQDAKELGLSSDQYIKFYTQYQKDGSSYLTFQDYLDDFKNNNKAQYAAEGEYAADYTSDQKMVTDSGYYDIDEYQYHYIADHPNFVPSGQAANYFKSATDWTPEVSQILRAHNIGLTLSQFNNYMKLMSGSDQMRQKAYQQAQSSYSPEQLATMNKQDYLHLQDDLLTAGYDSHAYRPDFTRDQNVALKQDAGAANDYKENYQNYVSWGVIPNQDAITKAITDYGKDHPQMSNIPNKEVPKKEGGDDVGL